MLSENFFSFCYPICNVPSRRHRQQSGAQNVQSMWWEGEGARALELELRVERAESRWVSPQRALRVSLLGSTWLSAASQRHHTHLFSWFAVALPLDLTCLRVDVTSVRQMGMMIDSKRNNMSYNSNSSDNHPHSPTQNLGEKIVAFINVRPTDSPLFFLVLFLCAWI